MAEILTGGQSNHPLMPKDGMPPGGDLGKRMLIQNTTGVLQTQLPHHHLHQVKLPL